MSSVLDRLTAAIAAVAPVDGIAILAPGDYTATHPNWYIVVNHDGVTPIRIDYAADATMAEIMAGDQVAYDFDLTGGTMQARPLYQIFDEVKALTSAQWNNLWQDANSIVDGVSKYLTSKGPNAAAIFSMDWTAQLGSTAGGQQTNARNSILSMYIQDNPAYAVAPPFDPTINIPGEEPVP